jgi:two-component system, NtrC family, response regulator AtoC
LVKKVRSGMPISSSIDPGRLRGAAGERYPGHAMTDSGHLRKVRTAETATVTIVPTASVSGLGEEPLSVLVLSQSFIAIYALPESGEVTVGRSNSVEIYVDDPLVSRRHAILSATPRPTIRDLGSSNGTCVHGVKLAPGVTRELVVGDVVIVGSAALLIQRGAATMHPRKFWDYEHFETRLQEECARADRLGSRFSVACLHVGRHVPDVGVRRILATVLRTSDVVGECGPSAYAILIIDAHTDQSRVVLDRIAADLAEHEVVASWGIAQFPDDGRTGEALLAKAQPASEHTGTTLAVAEGRIVADAITQDLFRVAERIAAGDISVLIIGETGVGKEVMAEEIHRRSPRADRPFLRLNCGALSESLLESELFGHERGAFTNAVAVKPGLFETADGGVVLLDEIGEMPMNLQVKLLRVIEEKQVRRVGGVKSRPLDVRFIAATNRDLEKHAARGLFRQDLYYRLAGATLNIPPLRNRPGDIEPLARSFLLLASRHLGVPATISPEALALLRAYEWPGNIRELRHVIERAVLLAGNTPITPEHLPVEKVRSGDRGSTTMSDEADGADDDDDRQSIVEVLTACGGNQSRAAKQLGMSRGALIRRLERYGIIRPRKPD